jgi:site-specific DNA-methyltransferase (adenine-specific)
MSTSTVINGDCLEAMKTMADNSFDLAIVDPPFGVNYARGKNGWGVCDNRPTLSDVKWDTKPENTYWTELFRVSANQIIWGGNYFTDILPVSKSWIIWDKNGDTENKSVFGDAELAWTSFNKVIRRFTLRQMGFITDTKDKIRVHPCQKPIELYEFLLTNYAKPGDRILDTHLGSGSSRIACYDLGFDFVGYELDRDYYEAQEKRFAKHLEQPNMFAPVVASAEQLAINF